MCAYASDVVITIIVNADYQWVSLKIVNMDKSYEKKNNSLTMDDMCYRGVITRLLTLA